MPPLRSDVPAGSCEADTTLSVYSQCRYRAEPDPLDDGRTYTDFYAWRGDVREIMAAAKREMAGQGYLAEHSGENCTDWVNDRGEFLFYIGPASRDDQFCEASKLLDCKG
jgi:hypothetical protein